MKHPRVAAWGFALHLALLAQHANAQPATPQPEKPPPTQWGVSFSLGAARYGSSDDLWRATRFAAAARSELFLGRTSNRSFGVGPSAFVGLTTLTELNAGAGAQVLLPIHEFLPLVVGAGIYGVNRENQAARPGGYASLGWGVRSFNFHGSYAMAGGLLLEARRDFAASPVTTWLASAQIDAAALALPVIWVINAFR